MRLYLTLLPGACFSEYSIGKRETAPGNLPGGIRPSLLKPPCDSFHKHCRQEIGYKLVRGWVDRAICGLPFGESLVFFDQVDQSSSHLHYKPGAAFPAKQRAIKPFVISNMFEELHKNLRRMF